jgi:hypothetical protein
MECAEKVKKRKSGIEMAKKHVFHVDYNVFGFSSDCLRWIFSIKFCQALYSLSHCSSCSSIHFLTQTTWGSPLSPLYQALHLRPAEVKGDGENRGEGAA